MAKRRKTKKRCGTKAGKSIRVRVGKKHFSCKVKKGRLSCKKLKKA
jgi:hypothetical protein